MGKPPNEEIQQTAAPRLQPISKPFGIFHERTFLEAIRSLEPSFQRLLAMAPVTPVTVPQSMPKSGIYLLSENDRHL